MVCGTDARVHGGRARGLRSLDPIVSKALVRTLGMVRTGHRIPTIAKLARFSTSGTPTTVGASWFTAQGGGVRTSPSDAHSKAHRLDHVSKFPTGCLIGCSARAFA